MNKDMASIRDEWRELRSRIGNLICAVDGKVESCEVLDKKMQEKKDESYLKGAEDMLEAIRLLEKPIENGGIPCKDMRHLFGSVKSSYIISNKSAEEIINGVVQWEKEKIDEISFEIGDEVERLDTDCELYTKYVIIRADPGSPIIWLLNLKTFCRIWFDKDKISDLKKTGRHFDTIDIPKEGIAI